MTGGSSDGVQRYNELPIHVRRHLEAMTVEMCETQREFGRRPKKVRDWVLTLDEDDVEIYNRLRESYRNATVVSRFLKWVGVTAFLVFMGMAGALEKIIGLVKFLFGARP